MAFVFQYPNLSQKPAYYLHNVHYEKYENRGRRLNNSSEIFIKPGLSRHDLVSKAQLKNIIAHVGRACMYFINICSKCDSSSERCSNTDLNISFRIHLRKY